MDKKKTVDLGPLEKIPLGQGFCFLVEEKEIAVFRPRNGGLCAIENRCPHRQGPLAEGVIDAQQVICPYHGHKFNLRTGEGSEAGERVRAYEAHEEKGNIIVDVAPV